jgi:cobalt-zinc-cadmium efflux system protein
MTEFSPPSRATIGRRFGIAMILNALIFIVELIGGLLTNSLALISDAMHNLGDFFALALSYIASKVVLWKSNSQKSYGYVRIEIFVAFLNALTLVLIAGYIIYEGLSRFFHPKPILGMWMIAVAGIGFIANTIATFLLRQDANHDLNAKSAYLHLLTDALESLAVVIVGILIGWQGWYILDPIVSIGIGIFVIRSAWGLLIETVNILTEGTPAGIDLEEVAEFIRSFSEVENVHHLHIWSLSSQFRALSAHLVVKDCLISRGCEITKRIEIALRDRFAINHPTLQLETEVCREQDTLVDFRKENTIG